MTHTKTLFAFPFFERLPITTDMFRPADLLCSIQATYNPVHNIKTEDIDKIERIPKSLKDEVKEKKCIVRTYELSKRKRSEMTVAMMSTCPA